MIPTIPVPSGRVSSGTKRTSAPVSRARSTISSTMSSWASRSPGSAATVVAVLPDGGAVVLLDDECADPPGGDVLPHLVHARGELLPAPGALDVRQGGGHPLLLLCGDGGPHRLTHGFRPGVREPAAGHGDGVLGGGADLVEQGDGGLFTGDVQPRRGSQGVAERRVDLPEELAGPLVAVGARQVPDALLAFGVGVVEAPGQGNPAVCCSTRPRASPLHSAARSAETARTQ